MSLNQQLFNFLFSLAHKSPILDGVFIFFAKYLTYLLVLAVVYWVFRREGRRRLLVAAELFISLIVARGLVTEWIRFFFYNPRPFEALGIQNLIPESGASFPSGHMTFLFSLAIIVFFYNKKFGTWLFGLSFLVGLSRIFAGVHWPYDILGGIVIGILCGFIVHKFAGPYAWKLDSQSDNGEEIVEIDVVASDSRI